MRRQICSLLALLLFTWPAAAAGQGGFTIEQALSAPFPEGVIAAPAGAAIAWRLNTAGARNVWVASAPDYAARQLTDFPDDDGLELSALTWAPDGKFLVFTRGSGPNRGGDFPNPAGVAKGTSRVLWKVTIEGTTLRLGEGGEPAIQPGGERLAFVRAGQIWWQSLSDTTGAEELVRARGPGSLRWSPDGSRLAFVSNRGDHSFIGVLDLATRRVVYLDPSLDGDGEPVWSPDGRSVAFLRAAANPDAQPFVAEPAATPWSIRIADAVTGVGREVWQADTGAGSAFRAVNAPNQLLWAEGDRLVFPWEKDGWIHLYSVPIAGGKPAALTPGPFEVEDVTLSPDRREVIYSSNQGDIDRRHLWRVSAGGGKPAAITRGDGLEWSPASTGDGNTIAFIHADGRRPPRVAMQSGAGAPKDLQPTGIPADFPERQLVEPEPVVFAAADGLTIHGQLFRPRNLKAGERRPAVIFFHGGSRRQMLLGWHYMEYYRNAYAFNQYLASRGFIVLSVNYRSGIGYGLGFREAPEYGVEGASEYRDVVGAGLYLRGRGDVDSARIGLWGGSYGGYLTALGLARASNLFKAGVDIHGVHDWNSEISNWVPDYQPAEHPDFARRAFESSPLASVGTWRSPVLLIHGDDDPYVPFGESVRLVAALRRNGVAVEQLVFPGETHFFLTHNHWLTAYHAAAEFLQKRLE